MQNLESSHEASVFENDSTSNEDEHHRGGDDESILYNLGHVLLWNIHSCLS